MSITRGVAWDNGTVTNDTGTSITASGTASSGAAGAMGIAILSACQDIAPTTPSGWTLEKSVTGTNAGQWIYRKFNLGSISSLNISYANAPSSGPVHLHVREYKTSLSGFALDQAPAINTGTSTTVVSTAQTTTGANSTTNDICIFSPRTRHLTPGPSLSSPTNSYAITGTGQNDDDGSFALNTAIYDKIISANVSAETAGVTASASAGFCAGLVSYNESGTGVDPATFLAPQCPEPQSLFQRSRMVPYHFCRRLASGLLVPRLAY